MNKKRNLFLRFFAVLLAVLMLCMQLLPVGAAGEDEDRDAMILGHVYPVYFGFRGGKGVLVGAMTLLLFDWRIFLVAFGLFVLAVAVTRWISLGSILGALSVPFTMHYFYHNPIYTAVISVLAAAVIYLHRSNIKRILSGTENKFSWHSKPQIENGKEPEDR